ncbi:MAG: type V CRISPR-associated protein Cas12a/Cpf1 [Patescibacteria group bacterium]
MDNKNCIFDSFIGKYELSKTLRFELKPTPATEKLLKQNKVFEKDKTIDDSYNQAKFYFDEMHREFINNSLAGLPAIIIKPLVVGIALKEEQEKNGNKKESNNEWEKTRKEFCLKIAEIFAIEDKKIELKYIKTGEKKETDEDDRKKKVKFLLSAKVLDYLKNKFPEEKESEFSDKKWPSLFVDDLENPETKKYVFSSFDKFSTYLSKFQETRNNLYSADDKATSVASRIIDNFVVFHGNCDKFENKLKDILERIGTTEVEKNIFQQNFYIDCFIQSGIDRYNAVVGNLNKKIKELRDKDEQSAKNEKKEFKKSNYPLLVELDKQILSYKDAERELIENDEDLKNVFNDFIKINDGKFKGDLFVEKFFDGEFAEEYGKIYLQKKVLNTISRKWFVDGNGFELLLPQTGKKEDRSIANIKTYISLTDIKAALEKNDENGGLSGDIYKDKYYDEEDGLRLERGAKEEKRFAQFLLIWKFEFESLFSNKNLSDGKTIYGYDSCFEIAKTICWGHLSSDNKNSNDYKKEVEKIKQYADASLHIYQMLKYFVLSGNNAPIGSDLFYGEFNDFYQDFDFIRYYNGLRNYITKKAFGADKIKLNFGKGTLLNGWQESPEGNAQFFGWIIRKNGEYLLGISKNTHFFDIKKNHLAPSSGEDFCEKLEFQSLNWGKNIVGGQVYKSFTGFSYKDHQKLIGKGEQVKIIKKLINEKYIKTGKFPELANFVAKEFNAAKEMQKDFQTLNIGGMKFAKIKASRLSEQVDNSGAKQCFYLFKIQNRDFNEYIKTGRKNIHSLYWEQIFSDENINNPVFSILGGAEIFFRKASENLSKKKDCEGNPVVEHKRYAKNKLFLHIPIKINSGKKEKNINRQVIKFLSGNDKINIIGIDRGEKNLLYYSVVNQKGEILDQGSLNTINGVDYFNKLVAREKERQADRESWNQIEQIKDLKKGYLSGVIHKICELIIKYDAIVVLEDLNMRFKQIRGGIERSVYQQFEKMLIDKLGYTVFKDRKVNEVGGVAKGYQLAAPFESFEKIFKQTGILFYTQADYTSVTDPVTGFRKNIYIGNSWSQEKIKRAIDKFKSIRWDDSVGGYAFAYDQANFGFEISGKNKKYAKSQEIVSKDWVIYSKVARIERFRNDAGYWEYQPINLNEKFKELFGIWGIDDKDDILRQIRKKEIAELKEGKLIGGKKRDFYHQFVYLFNLALQLRNSFSQKIVKDKEDKDIVIGDDIDFIASPVYPFFSMAAKSEKMGEISKLNLADFNKRILTKSKDEIVKNLNGDANGAYNIARKGIIILKKIKEDAEKPNLFISKNEWDEFAQGQYKKQNE